MQNTYYSSFLHIDSLFLNAITVPCLTNHTISLCMFTYNIMFCSMFQVYMPAVREIQLYSGTDIIIYACYPDSMQTYVNVTLAETLV